MTPTRMARTSLVCAALALLLLPAADGWGFAVSAPTPTSAKLVRWSNPTVVYFLHPSGSDNLSTDVVFGELVKGFEGWMATGCTSLVFKRGYHCNNAVGKCLVDNKTCTQESDCPSAMAKKAIPLGFNLNKRNELVFVENSNWKFGTFVLGVTSPVSGSNGVIFESDIAFNGYQQKWTTNAGKAGSGTQHLLSVAIHEEGHFFGAQHMLGGWSQSDPPTMAPNVWPYGVSATLNADDKKTACFLNPKSGSYTCNSNADCPYVNSKNKKTGQEYYSAKYVCQGGKCAWGPMGASGQTALGGTCSADGDCKTGLFCQPFGVQSYCSQFCQTNQANCPDGFACYGYQNGGGKGACMPDQGGPTDPPEKKKVGQACTDSSECETLLCLQGVCRVKCNPAAGTGCTDTEACEAVPPGWYGACVPSPLVALGAECNAPEECKSGLCMKNKLSETIGYCRNPCDGPGSCDAGFQCVKQAAGIQGCLPGTEKWPTGSECKDSAQCDGELCVGGDGQQFCSESCEPANPGACPCGMGCTDTSVGWICYPGAKETCVVKGGGCASNGECVSRMCRDGACTGACDVATGVGDCGPGEACQRPDDATAAGACEPQGAKGIGEACAADQECVTLFCQQHSMTGMQKRCLEPCDPTGGACSATDYACFPTSATLGACFLGSVANADAGGQGGGAIALTDDAPASSCQAGHRGSASALLMTLLLGLVALGWRRRAGVPGDA